MDIKNLPLEESERYKPLTVADYYDSLTAIFSDISGTEFDVCADIAQRQAKGIQKYGITVSKNPLELKAWLQHAYEECLDQAIYLKRAIQELK